MAIQDPHDQEHYALSHEKHNLSPRGDSLGYTFDAKGESPFTWIGFSDLTSELASAKADEPVSPKKVKACEQKKFCCGHFQNYIIIVIFSS
jgi:hypothetical protein